MSKNKPATPLVSPAATLAVQGALIAVEPRAGGAVNPAPVKDASYDPRNSDDKPADDKPAGKAIKVVATAAAELLNLSHDNAGVSARMVRTARDAEACRAAIAVAWSLRVWQGLPDEARAAIIAGRSKLASFRQELADLREKIAGEKIADGDAGTFGETGIDARYVLPGLAGYLLGIGRVEYSATSCAAWQADNAALCPPNFRNAGGKPRKNAGQTEANAQPAAAADGADEWDDEERAAQEIVRVKRQRREAGKACAAQIRTLWSLLIAAGFDCAGAREAIELATGEAEAEAEAKARKMAEAEALKLAQSANDPKDLVEATRAELVKHAVK